MKTGVLIIARLSSSRLPNKNMMRILDIPMIEHMVRRVQAARKVDEVIITTSVKPSDDPLATLAQRLGVECYRGPLDNIMARIAGCASHYGCDTIVELLGDNPLIHSNLIDDVVNLFEKGAYDYAATVTKEYPVSEQERKLFSIGVRVQVYSRLAAEDYTKYPEYINNDKKHPCAYLFENPDRYKIGYLEAKGVWAFMNRPELTFAVNYRKNFEMIRSIFEKNYPHDGNFSLEKVFRQLDRDKYLYLLMGS